MFNIIQYPCLFTKWYMTGKYDNVYNVRMEILNFVSTHGLEVWMMIFEINLLTCSPQQNSCWGIQYWHIDPYKTPCFLGTVVGSQLGACALWTNLIMYLPEPALETYQAFSIWSLSLPSFTVMGRPKKHCNHFLTNGRCRPGLLGQECQLPQMHIGLGKWHGGQQSVTWAEYPNNLDLLPVMFHCCRRKLFKKSNTPFLYICVPFTKKFIFRYISIISYIYHKLRNTQFLSKPLISCCTLLSFTGPPEPKEGSW